MLYLTTSKKTKLECLRLKWNENFMTCCIKRNLIQTIAINSSKSKSIKSFIVSLWRITTYFSFVTRSRKWTINTMFSIRFVAWMTWNIYLKHCFQTSMTILNFVKYIITTSLKSNWNVVSTTISMTMIWKMKFCACCNDWWKISTRTQRFSNRVINAFKRIFTLWSRFNWNKTISIDWSKRLTTSLHKTR